MPDLHAIDDPNEMQPVDWIVPGSERVQAVRGLPLRAAIDHFRDHPDSRILPVTDAGAAVVGAIFEEDIRRLLFNPFGHALLQNPAYGRQLDGLIRTCPMADVDLDAGAVLALYARATTDEGMILTRAGRLAGVVANRTLVRAAAARERAWARGQTERLARIDTVAAQFERDADTLADLLSGIGTDMGDSTEIAAGRAARGNARVVRVTASVERTDRGIAGLAEQARTLSETLDRLHAESGGARETAVRAVSIAALASARTGELATAARSIAEILALIQSVAKRVNMLSLNATMEAARAGPAGRGFAVVAGEVKALAGQTRHAADEIADRIAAILTMVDEVSRGQTAIRDVVATVDHLTGSVDATVAAQRGMTEHIAASAEAARDASQALATVFTEVGDETRLLLDHAGRMQGMAGDLTMQSGRLRATVRAFLADMRAA